MNIQRRLLIGAFGVSLLGFVQDAARPTIPLSEYVQRRARLMEALSDGIVVMEAEKLFAGMEGIDANTPRYDYGYLAGYHAAGDLLVLVPGEKEAFVFTVEDPEKIREETGLEHVLPREEFETFAKDVFPAARVVHARARATTRKAIEAVAPDVELRATDERGRNPIADQLARMRTVKSPAEILMMKKAAEGTNAAHRAAMVACRSGMSEGELQKAIEDTFRQQGCDGVAFPSIVGAGKNGTILHYSKNSAVLPADSLVVMDVGASYRGYASDITRTIPTDGVFGKEQREAYECALEAQKAAERILKPGVSFRELEAAAQGVFKARGLTKWSYAHSRDWSVRHGLGHFVGLAVHDSGLPFAPLEPGCVITIEPGYYDKDAGWGIRIEDIYLVTAEGFERWSSGAPREIEEIEKVMKEARK
ncbi:MAG: aminopeptidase P family protein [Planctomycetes bacterium]|nr:aminopeptidase P family protein [Planctomycetota bacterium]